MIVTTRPQASLRHRRYYRLRLLWCASLIYVAFSICNIVHHEPWVDEAQAWLLARDSSLWPLLTKLMRYEGSPGLWHTILHFCIKLGMPYAGINVVSGGVGLAAVGILLRYAPFPLFVRLLLPFTLFLAYQYSIIARNSVLMPVLLFLCAVFYNEGVRRSGTITALLCLLAEVNAQSFILSVCLWLIFHLRIVREGEPINNKAKRKLILQASAYLLTLCTITLLTWPTRDVTFARVPDWSVQHLWTTTWFAFHQAFGEGVIPIIVVGLTLPFLWKNGGWLLWLLSSFLLCLFGSVVYSIYWHWGFLFFIWLFALWISANRKKVSMPALAGLSLVIAVQCYWTFISIRFDWKYAYSGSLEAARYLQEQKLVGKRLYAIGLSCLAIQPYFHKNIFNNVNAGQNRAYWDWSQRNQSNDAVEHLGSSHAEYVMIGYLSAPEKTLWQHLVTESGYRFQKHFEGQTFWRTETVQPDSYDLYQRTKESRDYQLTSDVNMANPAATSQLLWGFYELSENSWRWTAQKFTVALQRPPGAERKGAQIHVHLFLPDEQMKVLGTIRLKSQISSYRLSSLSMRRGGSYEYTCNVPKEALFNDILFVDFVFDKTMPPSKQDARQLGAVVSRVRINELN